MNVPDEDYLRNASSTYTKLSIYVFLTFRLNNNLPSTCTVYYHTIKLYIQPLVLVEPHVIFCHLVFNVLLDLLIW